jgi:hypothetical protein
MTEKAVSFVALLERIEALEQQMKWQQRWHQAEITPGDVIGLYTNKLIDREEARNLLKMPKEDCTP